MKRNAILIICLGVALVIAPGYASALPFQPVGDPIEGLSWGQRFISTTPGLPYHHLQFIMIDDNTGDSFKNPNRGVAITMGSGWSQTYHDLKYVSADGPTPTGNLAFKLIFEGDKQDPLSVIMQKWETVDQTVPLLTRDIIAYWSGKSWRFDVTSGSGWNTYFDAYTHPYSVPDASIMFLLGSSLLVLGLLSGRESKN